MKYLIVILIFLNFGFVQAQGSLEQLQQKHDQQLAVSKARFEKSKASFERGIERLRMFPNPSNKAKEKARLEGDFKQAQGSQAKLKVAQNKEMLAARKKASPQERNAFDQARLNRIRQDVAAASRAKDQPANTRAVPQGTPAVQYGRLPSDAQRNTIQYSQLPNTNGQTSVSPTSVTQANRLLNTSPVPTGPINGAQQSQLARSQNLKQNQNFGALVDNKNGNKAEALRAESKKLDQSYNAQRRALAGELVQKKDRLVQNAAIQARVNQNAATTTKQLAAANTVNTKAQKKANAKLDAQIKKKSAGIDKSYVKKKKDLDKKIKKADSKVQKDIAKSKKDTKKKKSTKRKRRG